MFGVNAFVQVLFLLPVKHKEAHRGRVMRFVITSNCSGECNSPILVPNPVGAEGSGYNGAINLIIKWHVHSETATIQHSISKTTFVKRGAVFSRIFLLKIYFLERGGYFTGTAVEGVYVDFWRRGWPAGNPDRNVYNLLNWFQATNPASIFSVYPNFFIILSQSSQ